MREIKGRERRERDLGNVKVQRRGLLAKIHIAVKELGIPEDDYRNILKADYGVASAAALSIREMEDFVKRCEADGWEVKHKKSVEARQVTALYYRARGIAGEIENGQRRLRGACKSVCKVEVLEWCRDVDALKRLLAAMENIKRKEFESSKKR